PAIFPLSRPARPAVAPIPARTTWFPKSTSWESPDSPPDAPFLLIEQAPVWRLFCVWRTLWLHPVGARDARFEPEESADERQAIPPSGHRCATRDSPDLRIRRRQSQGQRFPYAPADRVEALDKRPRSQGRCFGVALRPCPDRSGRRRVNCAQVDSACSVWQIPWRAPGGSPSLPCVRCPRTRRVHRFVVSASHRRTARTALARTSGTSGTDVVTNSQILRSHALPGQAVASARGDGSMAT